MQYVNWCQTDDLGPDANNVTMKSKCFHNFSWGFSFDYKSNNKMFTDDIFQESNEQFLYFKFFAEDILFKDLFCLRGIGFRLYPEIFYFITQWSCSALGSLWEMSDSIPRDQGWACVLFKRTQRSCVLLHYIAFFCILYKKNSAFFAFFYVLIKERCVLWILLRSL